MTSPSTRSNSPALHVAEKAESTDKAIASTSRDAMGTSDLDRSLVDFETSPPIEPALRLFWRH